MSRRSRNRQDRFFSAVIMLLCLCAAGLVAAICVQSRLEDRHAPNVQALNEMPNATAAPLTLVAPDSQLSGTPTPSPKPTPVPTPAPTEIPFEYLPVYSKADVDEKVIAITLDDCSYLEALDYSVKAAEHYGAKLTLLPIASHLLKPDNMELLQKCVLELGFQVENRTLNNSSLYALNDFSMASEIWTADTAVDYALGKDYDMHLLRPKGGQGLDDPRTHAYLKQLGYDGFLTWSVSGTTTDIDTLQSSIAPGNVYLFSTTKEDVLKMVEFMEYAKKRGYEMVTVNELFGFPENACDDTEEDIMARTLPELDAYAVPPMELTEGDRSHAVYKLQTMLVELGYLVDPNAATPVPVEGGTPMPTLFLDSVAATANLADGVYGKATTSAVIAFQAAQGWPCTGVASVELQQLLQEEYTKLSLDQ